MDEGKAFTRARTHHGIEYSKAYSKKRRADRKAARRCINHEDRWSTHGVRCFECWLVHRVGRIKATELMTKSVLRCNGCEQLVPHGYGSLDDVRGLMHVRCARFPFVVDPQPKKEPSNGTK